MNRNREGLPKKWSVNFATALTVAALWRKYAQGLQSRLKQSHIHGSEYCESLQTLIANVINLRLWRSTLNRTREFCTLMLAAAAIAFAMHTTETSKAYPAIPVGLRDTCQLGNWHPDCQNEVNFFFFMTISVDKNRNGDIIEVEMTVRMPEFKVSQFTHVGQSFDDYRYEIINQAEAKLRSYIEAASKAYEDEE